MMRKMMVLVAFAIAATSTSLNAGAAEWKLQQAQLMTPWADDVSPENALPEYPRPQMVRSEWQNLNGLWDFAFGEAKPEKFEKSILVPYPVESALSGIMADPGKAERCWYQRTFTVPESWTGKRVILHFGAVDWEAEIFVNGKSLGTHTGGYDPFSFDITDALKDGGRGEQTLTVRVFDPTDKGWQPRGKQVLHPGGICYIPTTGIWQTVWMEPVVKGGIDRLIITPDVDKKQVRVTVVTDGEREVKILAGKRDVENDSLVEIAIVGSVDGKSNEELVIDIPEGLLQLWTPDTPYLYDLVAYAEGAGMPVDIVNSYFGMRKVSVGKDTDGITKLLLNDQFVFQVGPLDQGFWPDGIYTAPTDEALRFDIEATKQLGFNCTRKHVKVEPARWYYWCDVLGLLVWQDMPSPQWGTGNEAGGPGETGRPNFTAEQQELFKKELTSLIETHWNNPSIVMWVVFNEGWGQHDTVRYVDYVRSLDPNRWVSCASGWTDKKCGDMHDIHVYPGPGVPPTEEKRAAVLGEFGGIKLSVADHQWKGQTWGYIESSDRDAFLKDYQNLLAHTWELADDKGLSAAIYTQITDCEIECNGLLTYDRKIVKADIEGIAKATRGEMPIPKTKTILPDARTTTQEWRYTTEKPTDGWMTPEFNATVWKTGKSSFGTRGTPGAVIGTEWKTTDIWMRRTFTLTEEQLAQEIAVSLIHDEDAKVYINGVAAAEVAGFTSDYKIITISDAAKAALKAGENTIAIHCHQTIGGQNIDAGLVSVEWLERTR